MVTDGVRRESPYALVTFMSNVCRALDVELVRDWNTGHDRYWGEVGHYTIGRESLRACHDRRTCASYFVANRTNISFDLDAIENDEYHTSSDPSNPDLFYPLADVPDRVWKKRQRGIGRPHEGPNHFADMDQPQPKRRLAPLTLARRPDDSHTTAMDQLLPVARHHPSQHGPRPVPGRPVLQSDGRELFSRRPPTPSNKRCARPA